MTFASFIAGAGSGLVALFSIGVLQGRNSAERRINRTIWIIGLVGVVLFVAGVALMHRG